MTITQTKKKILYVITKGNWGGAQRYVYDLATHLPKDEFETAVAMGEGVMLDRKLNAAGIRTIRLMQLIETRRAGLQLSDSAVFFALLRLFKKERPDILHLNSSRAAFLGALASRLYSLLRIKPARRSLGAGGDKRLRIIFTVHGWPFKEKRSLPARIGIWLASYTTALASAEVIVLSQEDYRLARHMPGIKRKVSLIYHGVPAMRVPLPREEARVQLGGGRRERDALWIGTIAELTTNKGLACLIEAAARLKNKTLLCLIGDGEELERLTALAKRLGSGSRVIFAGFRENAAELLSAFDIFALPSLKEGLPYALLEAGSRGLPVVASDIPGIRDIISQPALGILTPPGETEPLARALAELLNNPSRRSVLGKTVSEHVRKKFSRADMVTKTLALYRATPA